MIEVVSVKFKNRGKCYFFSPNGLEVAAEDKVIVETAKGLEIADCHRGNHAVMDTAVVQPLRPVVRIATADDMRVAEINARKEKDAFGICQQKIQEHGLDMKLVDVECNFEGNKTMFFFTSDGRVDFRELVKDLAGIFRNRIELRQIGVRDEAKLLGGIGMCGRPYCCNQFLDDFLPVSTKMAKVQSLSLNPTKISGSCGRLMCCLRYEQEAYEELIKKVPKQGAFVETKDGYGTAVQVNLLRQTVKVRLDKDTDNSLHLFKANELAAVPGGRPKDGEAPPSVLNYVPEPEEPAEEKADEWSIPAYLIGDTAAAAPPEEKKKSNNRRRRNRSNKPKTDAKAESQQNADKPQRSAQRKGEQQSKKRDSNAKGNNRGEQTAKPGKAQTKPQQDKNKPLKVEAKPQTADGAAAPAARKSNNRRRYYNGKPKAKAGGENKQ